MLTVFWKIYLHARWQNFLGHPAITQSLAVKRNRVKTLVKNKMNVMTGEINFLTHFSILILLMIHHICSDKEFKREKAALLSAIIQQSWSKQKYWLEHDVANTGWVLFHLPKIWQDFAESRDGDMRMVVERVVSRLHALPFQNPKCLHNQL